ncbi:S-adenosylmethionine sensor upstream of mTORC1 [Coccinella septempunctata]|uniref:S-adenosylmethionine sensor upstream of mTORC1 n=1 Tax=Coccinella septempunctata TaxID=41139 RepID=UPI001D0796A1|nr:S-adenosylmethionine sensor upstream of mTORC1 [Coccinella septempunctata]
MASEDHIKLSDLIKSVHSELRQKSKNKGFEKAWDEHCKNDDLLLKYANAMKILATNHWQNNFTDKSKAFCRVEWIYKYCLQYFTDEESSEKLRQRQRELDIAEKIDISVNIPFLPQKPVLKLLDVGSCYNPFSVYNIFEVLAIDIAPASPCVNKMDFLKLELKNKINIEENTLAANYFDIVVFSLFLEYIPCPDLRFKCCEKAMELLRPEGLLFIITPDSKHVGANAQLMKSWRFMLAEIGFSRIKYEKLPHIHCMVFRKSIHSEIAQRWSVLHKNNQIFDKMFIPQDFLKKDKH